MTNFIRNRNHVEINTGAMADIAFLLLVFFLVATTVNQDQGLTLRLLPMPEGREIATIKDRNLFKVAIPTTRSWYRERSGKLPAVSGRRSGNSS